MALKYFKICYGCDHFCANNNDGLKGGCRAFPNGHKPDNICLPHSHDVVLDGQVGNFVYTPAKKEFNRYKQKIVRFQ